MSCFDRNDSSADRTPPSGTAADRRRTVRDWRVWVIGVLAVALIAAAGAVVAGLGAINDAKIAADRARTLAIAVSKAERRERDSHRATAYRLCSRNAVDRAFAHSRIRAREGAQAMAALQHFRVLAILDCKPNLSGQPALPMTAEEHVSFVDRWERRELTREELGICPNTPIGTALVPGKC